VVEGSGVQSVRKARYATGKLRQLGIMQACIQVPRSCENTRFQQNHTKICRHYQVLDGVVVFWRASAMLVGQQHQHQHHEVWRPVRSITAALAHYARRTDVLWSCEEL
jgi:hypothetical protein